FSLTALEGLATGTPLIVAAIGALDELLEAPVNCLKFPPGDVQALRLAVRRAHEHPASMTAMRPANRLRFETRHSAERSVAASRVLYQRVIERAHADARAVRSASSFRRPAARPSSGGEKF